MSFRCKIDIGEVEIDVEEVLNKIDIGDVIDFYGSDKILESVGEDAASEHFGVW